MFKIFKNNVLLQKLNNNKYFEELICIIICAISFITWLNDYSIGLFFILITAFILLLLFNDFKYMMPIGLSIIFSQSSGFSVDVVPIFSIIGGFLFIGIMLIYLIKNKLNLKNCKSWIPIALMAILGVLPLIWNNNVGDNQYGLYFLYFAWAFYLLLYLLFAGSLKQNSFRMLCYTMTWLGILLTLECLFTTIEQYKATGEILYNFDLGWGICNEAGIMTLVSLPFVFIRLIKSDKILKVFYNLILIFILVFGVVLTNSRGTYLFGSIELICLAIISLIYGKKRWTTLFSYLFISAAILITVQIKVGIPQMCQIISEEVYGYTIDINGDGVVDFSDFLDKAFNDNGRRHLWELSLESINSTSLNKYFGSGMIPVYDYASRLVVYHSTVFETLGCFGAVGLIVIICHIIQKYINCMKLERGVMVIVLFGYACVDMYGMLDNTYHMYYYMVPLMIIMASIDVIKVNIGENNINL